LPGTVARFEPPASGGLREAIGGFDCVAIGRGADEDPGEVLVREFLSSGEMEQQASLGTSTTYLVSDLVGLDRTLVGYVTLAPSQIRLTNSERRDSGLRDVAVAAFGAVRIAMIGVDHRFAGRGYGHLLMQTTIRHTASMGEHVTIRFVIADAANTQLHWYERQGFVENRARAEVERVAASSEDLGSPGTSMRLDLGPDPRRLL
jgi:ribosomal protein S18 acetylase RimI-like enzyme